MLGGGCSCSDELTPQKTMGGCAVETVRDVESPLPPRWHMLMADMPTSARARCEHSIRLTY